MVTLIIISAIVIIAAWLVVKINIASKKPVEQRSATDQILASFAVWRRQQVEEMAEAVRTPEISRTECIQKIKDAQRELQTGFKNQIENLMLNKQRMETLLVDLKTKPGLYEGKAKKTKEKYEQADDPDLKNDYKNNAMMYIGMKKRALERIDKVEKFIKTAQVSVDRAKASYDAKKSILEEMEMELASLQGQVLQVKFSESMATIRSLKQETVEKLQRENASIEASNLITDSNSSAEEFTSNVSEADFESL